MWVAAFIGMATSFAECSLAQLYKERDVNGQFRGGPAWYMARGLGMRWMGVLFAVFLLIAYGIIFSGVQANAVARALSFSFDFPPLVTGIILAVFALLAITRGLHGVARLMQGFVPLMAIIWVLTSLVICVMNIGQLPHVIWSIFESAFGWQEAAGGAAGYTLSRRRLLTVFSAVCFPMRREWVLHQTQQRQLRPGLRIRQRKGLSR